MTAPDGHTQLGRIIRNTNDTIRMVVGKPSSFDWTSLTPADLEAVRDLFTTVVIIGECLHSLHCDEDHDDRLDIQMVLVDIAGPMPMSTDN